MYHAIALLPGRPELRIIAGFVGREDRTSKDGHPVTAGFSDGFANDVRSGCPIGIAESGTLLLRDQQLCCLLF